MDPERYNLLYKPKLEPERQFRSEAVFPRPTNIPIEAIVPPVDDLQSLIDDWKELEDLIIGLPDGLQPIGEIVRYLRQRAEILGIEEKLKANIPTDPPIIRTPPDGSPPGSDISIPESGTPQTGSPIPTKVIVTPPHIPTDSTTTTQLFPPYTGLPYSPGSPGAYNSLSPEEQEARGSSTGNYYDDDFSINRLPEEDISGSTYSPDENPTIHIGSNIPMSFNIGTNVQGGVPNIPGIPYIFPQPTNITLEVTTPKNMVEITQDLYTRNQIDLQKYYLENLRSTLQKYFQHQLAIMADLNMSDLDLLTKNYDGGYVKVENSNIKHLNDSIIRSQLQRAQKAKYFKKIANTDQTLMHLRAWNAAAKMKERYYDETYGDSDDYINSESNALLRQARADYDASYNNALYNTYRYLDASLQITEDILNHTMQESKAKAKLIKEGCNIFETATYSEGEGLSTTQPKTSDQIAAEQEAAKQEAQGGQQSASDIDKAAGITDPAPESIWGKAPSGSHYSEADINSIEQVDSDTYNTQTEQGRENIKTALNNSSKYMPDTETANRTAQQEAQTQQSNGADNATPPSEHTTVVESSANKVDEIVSPSNVSVNNTSSTTSSSGSSILKKSTFKASDLTDDDKVDIIKDRMAALNITGYSVTTSNTLFQPTEFIVQKLYKGTLWMGKSSKHGIFIKPGDKSKITKANKIPKGTDQEKAWNQAHAELDQLSLLFVDISDWMILH